MEFVCKSCGKPHELDNLSFGADSPSHWTWLTQDEQRQSELSSDQCIINARGETHYFVRGCLEIPIQSSGRVFVWGVWTSLSEKSFDLMHDNWDNPKRTELPPCFGWLCTGIPSYPDTMYLKTHVHQREVGQRPLVVLEPTDHPLAVHQRNGISTAELERIVTSVLHKD